MLLLTAAPWTVAILTREGPLQVLTFPVLPLGPLCCPHWEFRLSHHCVIRDDGSAGMYVLMGFPLTAVQGRWLRRHVRSRRG